jgi:hypothetical protein
VAKAFKSHLLEQSRAYAESVSAKRVEQPSCEVIDHVKLVIPHFEPAALQAPVLHRGGGVTFAKPGQLLPGSTPSGFGH